MRTAEQSAARLQVAAYALVGLVTVAWMAGIGLGIGITTSENAQFVRDTPAILIPGLMGAAAVAIIAVILSLNGIVQRIRIRAQTMSDVLPQLLERSVQR